MTQQPLGPTRSRADHPEPKAMERSRAFIQERLGNGQVDEQGSLAQVDPDSLPKRSDQLTAYRNLEAMHNPVFPGASSGSSSSSGNQGSGNQDPGLLIGDQTVTDSLLPGHFYPIGPSALLDGQAGKRETSSGEELGPTVSGRITALSIGTDGDRIYAGAANGGVWRSDNGGVSWRPLMNAIHLAPTTAQSDSLSIGAVAMDPDQPDRIFVGTGEGPGLVSLGGAPEFFGIGPISSEDGGYSWQFESVEDTRLTGSAFFRMLLDPDDANKVTAASRHGVMQRQPRNRRLASTFKPQVYFYRHSLQANSLSTYYLNQSGANMVRAWAGGGGYLEKNDWITPFEFNGIPYFLQYNRDTGEIMLDLWEGNGEPSLTLSSDFLNNTFGKGWTDFLPVTLLGKAYMLTYSQSSGLATLWFLDIRNDVLFYSVEPVWKNRNFGKGWTNFLSVTILGQPYFLAYNLNNGQATLQRWYPNGEFTRVFLESWPRGIRIVTFNFKAASCFLWVSSLDGSGNLHRWNADGSFDSIRILPGKTFVASINLQLIPYIFNNESRLLTYDLRNGAVSSFRWTPDWNLELLETQIWDPDLIVNTFNMGFEWVTPQFDPKPKPSPNLPEPKVPTASGLALAKSAGVIHYYAAFWDDQVYRSEDGGKKWSVLGTGFPNGAGRVTLASQNDNQDVLYAFTQQGLVYRWDRSDNKWRKISGVPPKKDLVGRQGNYDLSIAVSPNDIDTIYLGGSATGNGAALYRCKVTYSKGTVFNSVSMIFTLIGNSVHSDVHALEFTQRDPDKFWVGCDGGVFFTNMATTTDPMKIRHLFEARNCGLGTQTVNFVTQFPSEDAIIFCGTQDNGSQRTIGNAAWQLASFGDGGRTLIDWSMPENVLFPYIRNQYQISKDGGGSPGENKSHKIPNVKDQDTLFYPPFAGTPAEVAESDLSKRIAYGSKRVWINDGFGEVETAWVGLTSSNLGSNDGFLTKSLTFVSSQRLLAGLMNGRVYRYDENKGVDPPRWDQTRLDTIGGGLPVSGPITGFAPDPEDNTQVKFYISLGGAINDFRRVWYFDGNAWEARSGPGKNDINALLDIQYNTLAIARINNETHLFAGADIGVWHSQDGGKHWRPFGVGLPEAAVFDLQIFPGDAVLDRPWLLRAATYGRSIYERVLAGGTKDLQASLSKPVQLFIRTNLLDRGLYPAKTRAINGYVFPDEGDDVRESVDMKLLKSGDGTFSQPADIDFCQFQLLKADNNKLKPTTTGRYYIRVHTRGAMTVDQVEVRLFITKVADIPKAINDIGKIPDLPANLPKIIKQGNPLPAKQEWDDLGTTFVNGLFAGTPLVASVDFPLLGKGTFVVLAVLNQAKDPFVDKTVDVVRLIENNRKAALSIFVV